VGDQAPFGFVRHREGAGTIMRSRRIDRYWKNKQTGVTVEVKRYLSVTGDVNEMRVIFFDPVVNHELSMEEREFREQHEVVGNLSSKF